MWLVGYHLVLLYEVKGRMKVNSLSKMKCPYFLYFGHGILGSQTFRFSLNYVPGFP